MTKNVRGVGHHQPCDPPWGLRLGARQRTGPLRLSGWCSPSCGPRAHATCQARIDGGLLDGCDCGRYGGHTKPDETTEDAA